MPRFTLEIPDFNEDVGEFVTITVTADDEAGARAEARRQRPEIAWDMAHCVQMLEPEL